jgi:hypothetical protein
MLRATPGGLEKVHSTKKEGGGLGIINPRSQNVALLLKHLDKFYNRRDIVTSHP